jgi:hypothetical protein
VPSLLFHKPGVQSLTKRVSTLHNHVEKALILLRWFTSTLGPTCLERRQPAPTRTRKARLRPLGELHPASSKRDPLASVRGGLSLASVS